jgi:hypothetical protein
MSALAPARRMAGVVAVDEPTAVGPVQLNVCSRADAVDVTPAGWMGRPCGDQLGSRGTSRQWASWRGLRRADGRRRLGHHAAKVGHEGRGRSDQNVWLLTKHATTVGAGQVGKVVPQEDRADKDGQPRKYGMEGLHADIMPAPEPTRA